MTSTVLSSYHVISTQSSSSYEGDIDMREAGELQQGSDGDSDRDSTTVSYSLDEDNLPEVEEEVVNMHHHPQSHDGQEPPEYPPRPDGPPPSYDEIVKGNQDISSSPPPPPPPRDTEDEQLTPTPTDHVTSISSSIEFPLTHFYELEGRVHTEQWSIPYKRNESLGVCMVATIKMIREGGEFLSCRVSQELLHCCFFFLPPSRGAVGPALVEEADENCKKFLQRTMPDGFNKVLSIPWSELVYVSLIEFGVQLSLSATV